MKIFLWNICQPCGLRFKQVEQPWKLVSTVMSHNFMSLKQVYREVQVHLWVYGNVVKTTLPVDLKLVFYFFILNLWTFYLFIDCFAWLEQNMSFLLIPKKQTYWPYTVFSLWIFFPSWWAEGCLMVSETPAEQQWRLSAFRTITRLKMFLVRVMHAFSHVNWTPAMHCILQSLAKCQITDWDKKERSQQPCTVSLCITESRIKWHCLCLKH